MLLLLFVGFASLAVAFWLLNANWAGLLLPLGYVIGAWASLRKEVREIELREEALIVRTFFRGYPIPRANIKGVVRTPRGAAIDVLNGNRYEVTPPGTNPGEIARALEEWLR
jgi:hypothetical protein